MLKISDRDLFTGLGVCKLESQLGIKPAMFQKKKKKLKAVVAKILENYWSCNLSPGLVQDGYQS